MADLNFETGGEQYGMYFPPLRPLAKAIRRDTPPVYTAAYEYEPGNASRYVVVFNTYDFGYGQETVMTVANLNASMIVPGPFHSPSQIGYMAEKLGLLEGDCYALMPLINHYLEELGK
jgi:hypothetical protein